MNRLDLDGNILISGMRLIDVVDAFSKTSSVVRFKNFVNLVYVVRDDA